MPLHIGSTVLDVRDVAASARFWSAVLDYVPRADSDDTFVVLVDPRRAWSHLSLQRSEEPKRDVNRVHLDLYAEDAVAEVERIERLGGRRIPWDYEPDPDYVVMADPDGNEFCIVQR